MTNKKAQELSIGTLVLIVLGIIVLVLLVLGFSMGWDNLFSKIGIFQGSDLSSMVAACKTAAASQSQTSYCEFKSVKLESGKEFVNCEDNRVKASLTSTLNCNSPEKTTCRNMINAKGDIDKDKYNGKTCRELFLPGTKKETACADVNIGENKAVPMADCPKAMSGQIAQSDIGPYITLPKGFDHCCILLA